MDAEIVAHPADAVAHRGDDHLHLDRQAVLAGRGQLDPRASVLALELHALVVAGERRDLAQHWEGARPRGIVVPTLRRAAGTS
jgi:hypothetical protein